MSDEKTKQWNGAGRATAPYEDLVEDYKVDILAFTYAPTILTDSTRSIVHPHGTSRSTSTCPELSATTPTLSRDTVRGNARSSTSCTASRCYAIHAGTVKAWARSLPPCYATLNRR